MSRLDETHDPARVSWVEGAQAGADFPVAVGALDDVWAFGSAHPGLAQFLFADGSVHPVRKHINPITLGFLADRGDGQVIPPY